MDVKTMPPGVGAALDFPLVQALMGRRARRFAVGASIPEGALKFESQKEPMPLSGIEQMMVLLAAGGNTGWHNLIPFNPKYSPYLPNYAGSAGGRTFPSAAGFETSEIFFTNDDGVYMLATRDAPALVQRREDGSVDYEELINAHWSRIRKLGDGRLYLPREEPYFEGHNLWVVNVPGSLLVIPIGDLAQHMLLGLAYYLQNGYVTYDDINNQRIPGLERFSRLADLDNPLPLTFIEMWGFGECVAELTASCYAGALMLQSMGLGGWLFNGLNPYAVLGASGDPNVPGLGFRYDADERWSTPNPTGLPGVFEGYCPPHYPDMRAAVEAMMERKFGPGGPFNQDTPGPYKDTSSVRSAAQVHDEEFKECLTVMAQYIYDRFGKFPATVPSIVVLPYLQAHHLDLEFYDTHFQPGSYLETHAKHMEMWHPEQSAK